MFGREALQRVAGESVIAYKDAGPLVGDRAWPFQRDGRGSIDYSEPG